MNPTPSCTHTEPPQAPIISTPTSNPTTPRLVNRFHKAAEIVSSVIIDVVFDTSSKDSYVPPSAPFPFEPTTSTIPRDLIPLTHFIPYGFPNIDSFVISLIAKITSTRNMNAQSLDPNEVST